MLTTLSILSRDQGRLTRRPASEEAWFARFQQVAPPEEARQHWYSLGIEWPQFRKPVDTRKV